MNLVSTLVGLSIAGVAAPSLVDMSIAPFQAQKRAQNLGEAESNVVTYVAANEGQPTPVGSLPRGCIEDTLGNNSFEVTCDAGKGAYKQTVKRSYRRVINSNGGNTSNNGYRFERPKWIGGHQCPNVDPWGVNHTNRENEAKGKPACLPQILWSRGSYLASNPSSWLYDIDNFNGWGHRANPQS